MRRIDDSLWKGLLEVIFDDVLRFLFPGAGEFIDLGRGFEYLDKELTDLAPAPGLKPDNRRVDKLVKVYTSGGEDEWFLVHVEIQGQSSKNDMFPKRMYDYHCRMSIRHDKPITGIALFTGPDGGSITDRYGYRIWGSRLLYQYNTYAITETSEEELLANENPFALVVLAARLALPAYQTQEETILDKKLRIADRLFENKQISIRKRDAILVFLENIFVFSSTKFRCIFDQHINTLTHKSEAMDIFEELAAYKVERVQESVVRKLLAKTDFSDEDIAAIVDNTVEFVEEVKELIEEEKEGRPQ